MLCVFLYGHRDTFLIESERGDGVIAYVDDTLNMPRDPQNFSRLYSESLK